MGLTKVSYAMINGAPLNVLDYGAKGDGVTNDTAAIQAALDATYALALQTPWHGGVSLYFPKGTYKCGALTYGADSTFTRAARVFFYGETGASIILSTVTAGQNAFTINRYEGVNNTRGHVFQGLTFRSQNYAGNGLVFSATNILQIVDECIFHGFDYNFINYSGIGTTVQNCTFEAAQTVNYWSAPATTGISGLDEQPANLRFLNNWVGYGFATDGTVKFSQYGIGGPVSLGGGFYGLGVQAVIENNIFEGIVGYSINNVPLNAAVRGNWFENRTGLSTYNGIAIYGEIFYAEISNNFYANSVGGQLFASSGGTLNTATNQNNIYGNWSTGTNETPFSKFRELETNTFDTLNVSVNDPTGSLGTGAGIVAAITTNAGYQFISRDTTNASGKFWKTGVAPTNNAYTVYNQNNTGVYITDGGTSWTANSDETLKTNLTPIENALDKVNTLRAVTGRYKTDDESVSRSFLIAQDVQAVLPEAVNVRLDGTLGLQYTDVIPLLVAAIKEQNAKIAALEGQLLTPSE